MPPNNDDDDAVGYGRPPKASQFKPGQSGNPEGRRKKKKKSFKEELEAELNEKISVTENGRRIQITKRRALIKAVVNRGITSSQKAAEKVIELDVRMAEGDEPTTADLLGKDEQAILDEVVLRAKRKIDAAAATVNKAAKPPASKKKD